MPNSCTDSKRFVIAVSGLWAEDFFLSVCLKHDNKDMVRYSGGSVEETQICWEQVCFPASPQNHTKLCIIGTCLQTGEDDQNHTRTFTISKLSFSLNLYSLGPSSLSISIQPINISSVFAVRAASLLDVKGKY